MSEKRKHESNSLTLSKRQKDNLSVAKHIKRTSSLSAPILHLTGHEHSLTTAKFSPSGTVFASAGFDKNICNACRSNSLVLWNTSDTKNFNVLKGHASPILELAWSRDGESLYTASADKTLGVWDAETGSRGHKSHVNALSPSIRGQEMLVSVSDDSSAKIWDLRSKYAIHEYEANAAFTACAWANDGGSLFVGGLDETIKAYDLRKPDQTLYTLTGHADTITCLRTSPDGTQLLSNSMDNTLAVWDIKPFALTSSRLIKKFEGMQILFKHRGAPHGFEKNLIKCSWHPSGDYIASGSGDRSVVIWDAATRAIAWKLPGHKGCVNEVAWHPLQPVLISASSDKCLFLGEVDLDDV